MLNCLTVSALLKTVILATSCCVVLGFSLNAWDAWGRLQMASRISRITDASADMFKAMHNLRTDRSTTIRLLNGDRADGQRDREISAHPSRRRNAGHGNALAMLGEWNSRSRRRWFRSSTACSRC